jgi:hypothetical protein
MPVDLSSLHLLGLLADDDQQLILAALPDMATARSAVTDTILTREKTRALGVATYTAALRHDDSIEKTTLTPAQHAALRDQAVALEARASSMEIRVPTTQQDARPTPSPSRWKAGCLCGATTWTCGSGPANAAYWPSASWT